MIQLSVGRLEVDWGKNLGFSDHSALFQPSDVALVPYYYAKDRSDCAEKDGEGPSQISVELKEGLSKPLVEVRDRVELLGHTIACCAKEFQHLADFNGFDSDRFQFDALRQALARVDVNKLALDYDLGDCDFGELFREQIFPKLGMSLEADGARGVLWDAAQGMENLSSHSVLRLLAENAGAVQLPVIWAYKDIEIGGWADRTVFVRPLAPENRFLVVTEGSSDALILRQALKLIRPHIADFFDFVDMEEGYPFAGTGNLYRFVQGLISISVQNNVIVLFDNDAEGCFNFERCNRLNVPANMKILKLPDLDEFREFETVGPSGSQRLDINGKGAALECYLQLDESACVRWSSYHSSLQVYQGALVNKAQYKERFLAQTARVAGYDYRKIESVLNAMVSAAVGMKEAAALGALA